MEDASFDNRKTIAPSGVYWLAQALEEYSEKGKKQHDSFLNAGFT